MIVCSEWWLAASLLVPDQLIGAWWSAQPQLGSVLISLEVEAEAEQALDLWLALSVSFFFLCWWLPLFFFKKKKMAGFLFFFFWLLFFFFFFIGQAICFCLLCCVVSVGEARALSGLILKHGACIRHACNTHVVFSFSVCLGYFCLSVFFIGMCMPGYLVGMVVFERHISWLMVILLPCFFLWAMLECTSDDLIFLGKHSHCLFTSLFFLLFFKLKFISYSR